MPPVLLLRFQACPSLIVTQSGGGDGFLFRPSKIPFLDVAQRWIPFAAASGSVALSELCLFITIILMSCFYLYNIIYIGVCFAI